MYCYIFSSLLLNDINNSLSIPEKVLNKSHVYRDGSECEGQLMLVNTLVLSEGRL